METVTVHTAKMTLSELLARVEAGEEIVLDGVRSRSRSSCLISLLRRTPFGALRGVVTVGPEFFEPLPDGELGGWRQ